MCFKKLVLNKKGIESMKLNIIEDFLTVNPYSRSGYQRSDTQAIVIHYVGKAKQSAKSVRDYFESLKIGILVDGKPRYAGAQYIVGLAGEIVQTMSVNEIAAGCGWANKVDPISKKPYTDLARELFSPKYVLDRNYSPSYATINIEMCHTDDYGRFTEETVRATSELVASLFKQYGFTDVQKRLITHKQVVGWKDCPLWYSNHPEDLNTFKLRVESLLKEGV
jgi:N-acetylmuramoyl-L-alanine amidase